MKDDPLIEPREREVAVGSFRFNLAEAGDGPPVLLLHGWPDSWLLWRHQLAALAANGRRAVAPDLPGLGKSDRPEATDAYRLDQVASSVVGLLDTPTDAARR